MLPEQNLDTKDIDTTEGAEPSGSVLRSTIKAPPTPSDKAAQVDTLSKAVEFAIKQAKLSFEQEHLFKRALRQEYTRLVLGRGEQ